MSRVFQPILRLNTTIKALLLLLKEQNTEITTINPIDMRKVSSVCKSAVLRTVFNQTIHL